jgi:hypothetical protein
MDRDKALRDHLLYLLRDGGAHLDFDRAVADLPPKPRGARLAGMPHTPWQLAEHLRIAQWDILEFSRASAHFCVILAIWEDLRLGPMDDKTVL